MFTDPTLDGAILLAWNNQFDGAYDQQCSPPTALMPAVGDQAFRLAGRAQPSDPLGRVGAVERSRSCLVLGCDGMG